MKNDVSSDFIRFFFGKINHYKFFFNLYQKHFIFPVNLEKELSIKTQFTNTKIDLTEQIVKQNSLDQETNISTIAVCN